MTRTWDEAPSRKTAEARVCDERGYGGEKQERQRHGALHPKTSSTDVKAPAGGLSHVFEDAARRRVGDAVGPIDAEGGVDGAGDVLDEDAAVAAPSGIGDFVAGRGGGAQSAAAFDAAAGHRDAHRILPVIAARPAD